MELKNISKQKNKKGSTFEGWTEGVIFSIMFVIILGTIVLGGMNKIHNENYAIEGLKTDKINQNFKNYQEAQSDKISGGEASFLSIGGLSLSTSWDMITSVLTMVMDFITGGWTEALVSYLGLPEIVGFLLRGLWIVALGFIILGIVLRRKI